MCCHSGVFIGIHVKVRLITRAVFCQQSKDLDCASFSSHAINTLGAGMDRRAKPLSEGVENQTGFFQALKSMGTWCSLTKFRYSC